MPRDGFQPHTHKARGLSDVRDGTNAFEGAMTSLVNLIPAPDTEGLHVPRPASLPLTDFSGLDGAAKGIPNLLYIVGNIGYGMIPETSGSFAAGRAANSQSKGRIGIRNRGPTDSPPVHPK